MNGCTRVLGVRVMPLILKQYVLKRLGVLSLRAVAVLLSDRRDQIGIGDNKENKKHVLDARRLADKAALDHAFMMRASRGEHIAFE